MTTMGTTAICGVEANDDCSDEGEVAKNGTRSRRASETSAAA